MTPQELLDFSNKLEKDHPNKSAYWHLKELRDKIKESIKE